MVFKPENKTSLVNAIKGWNDGSISANTTVPSKTGSSDLQEGPRESDGAVANSEYGDINDWDVTNVTDFSNLFRNGDSYSGDTTTFNSNIGGWNTAAVTSMYNMFYEASAFNQDIGGWNTANVTNMQWVFDEASAFNQDIGGWNTAAVTTMYGMFYYASAFNQDIGDWNVSKVKTMEVMFYDATAFNQDIGGWDTSAVTDMDVMFQNATAMNTTFSGVTGFGNTPEQAFFNQPRPQLSTSTPNDNATNVSQNSSIVLTFDESVDVETGNITIKKTSDDSTIETIDVTSSQVTGSGTNKITIKPSKKLPFNTKMYVLIDRTSFDDSTSLSYLGITSTTALSFTTKKPTKKKKRDLIKQINELLSTDQGELSYEEVKEKLRNGEELSMNGYLIIIKAAISFAINNENQVVYIITAGPQINKIYDDIYVSKNAGYLNSALEYYNNIFNVSPYYTNISVGIQ